MKRFLLGIMVVMAGLFALLRPAAAQDLSACPEALPPRLVIGESGRVTPGDANNVRDTPSRQGEQTGEIPAGGIFTVLDGPVCADGLIWWQVDYQELVGWTVEGSGEYWLEPYTPPATPTPAPPTATPVPTATPLPAVAFKPLRPVINVLAAGVQARVIDDAPDGSRFELTIRSEPTRNAVPAGQVVAGDIVTVLSDATEADGFFWREIETAEGERGWVVEGFDRPSEDRYDRTLLPACPLTQDRLIFFIERHIFTSNRDGSELCVFDRMWGPGWYTFYPYLTSFINEFSLSPDGSEFYFVDNPDRNSGNLDLYTISLDGLTRRRITVKSDVLWLNWSPDKQRVLLSQMVEGSGTAQIWTMRADGSVYGTLSEGEGVQEWAAWLGDSETVAYAEIIGREINQIGATKQQTTIYTVNVVKGGKTSIYQTDREVLNMTISPDRSKLIIQSWGIIFHDDYPYGDRDDYRIELLDIATGEIENLPPEYYSWSWMPDSAHVYSYSDEGVTLYALETGEITSVSLSAPLPYDFYGYSAGFLDDSTLLYITDGASYETPDDDLLLSVNLLTGEVTTLVGPVGE